MEFTQKGPAYEKATESERRLRLFHVPSRYWSVTPEDVKGVHSCTIDRPWKKSIWQLDAGSQKKVIASAITGTALKDSAPFVLAAGDPTDSRAMAFGAAVVKRALELNLRPVMINVTNDPKKTDYGQPPNVVVLWNVRFDSTPGRIESCRDWLAKFDGIYRVLVVAGTDPTRFAYQKLNLFPESALYFRGEYGEDD